MDDVIDVTFAHNVRAYVATTKGRALKVTPEVAAGGGVCGKC